MARRGGFQGGMPGNMNNMLKQAQRMQKQLEEAQEKLSEMEITGSAGGGVVEAVEKGNYCQEGPGNALPLHLLKDPLPEFCPSKGPLSQSRGDPVTRSSNSIH